MTTPSKDRHSTRRMPRPAVDFLPQLQRGGKVSLEQQLVLSLREAIVSGRLRPGMRLPSSRRLAAELQVNRNTVIKALEQLISEDYVIGKIGSGTFVNKGIKLPFHGTASPSYPENARWLHAIPEPLVTPPQSPLREFRVCQPSTAAFPQALWRKAWGSALRQPLPDDYSVVAGEPELRVAIAEYLGRTRGLFRPWEDVLVSCGALQAIHLIAQATLLSGATVAFEEPGYLLARQAFESHGARIMPIPVDTDGMRVDMLPEGPSGPLLVYVTPSHQFPLGVRLSLSRRLALLEWATRNDALIVEDDYDSEFRYDAPPLPSLASLDKAGRVVYVGTFSKVISPCLRVGYVLAPPPLRDRLERLKCLSDYHTSVPLQLALAAFMKEGFFEQHISRMRRLYAEKRFVLAQALASLKPDASFLGLEAGLHMCITFGGDVDAHQLVQKSLKHGILVTPLSQYYLGSSALQGLVLGYGGLEVHEIEQTGRQLASIISVCISQAYHPEKRPGEHS
ncbi:PLP-dependent aminotransferase family protein [Ktedonosporobacter rubrisoli]|uniref:PLP-dependent aminotransferase family protein n=1 Tax=Ktedonosporobacter rubrisoli TaxID=2509675 RepID=A0A4P6JNV3_KTERU|nr:PLP-dependent aminotransferase family protein [Ktedonosporobacter rubrisoli]QBD77009.1 PLP-dependent aminotransferase family protein [Ktedonosporobacter rubrisoli]